MPLDRAHVGQEALHLRLVVEQLAVQVARVPVEQDAAEVEHDRTGSSVGLGCRHPASEAPVRVGTGMPGAPPRTPSEARPLIAGGERGRAASRSPMRSYRRRSGRGAHQLSGPSSSISEGTSSARMIVASIRTARTAPSPSSLTNTISEVENAPSATANRSAAAVTTRPVRSRPMATASRSLAPASRASLIRESRNTP